MKKPDLVDIKYDELQSLLQRIKSCLSEDDYKLIKGLVDTVVYLLGVIADKTASIRKLRQMLFGSKTEKSKNVLMSSDESQKDSNLSDDVIQPVSETGTDSDSQTNDNVRLESDPITDTQSTSDPQTNSDTPTDPETQSTSPKKGHGRNGAEKYTAADVISVKVEALKPGDPCPECLKGKVYNFPVPGRILRVTGQAPLHATLYELEKLRCNLCGQLFTAKIPESAGDQKYDEAAGSLIAILKYGSGVPFYRLEQLQEGLGIPLPASTQWDVVENVANQIHPVYNQLIREASQGEVVYNDDTPMKILDLAKNDDKSRKGLFTTGILSTNGDKQIALYFTGQQHAGENLTDVLKNRSKELETPIQMCDGLDRNLPKALETIVCNCNSHARRNFVNLLPIFPDECEYVIKQLALIYKNDEIAKDQGMSPGERLDFHQRQSISIMEELKEWLERQLDEKKVEPNSSMGKAISYMLKRWEKLTRFLSVAGAPLDNNLCEQILKRAILHRKNSLFYKTEFGANIGDLFMSIIQTCRLNRLNPFDYINELQKHSSEVFKNPGAWMPWNYRAQLQG